MVKQQQKNDEWVKREQSTSYWGILSMPLATFKQLEASITSCSVKQL